MGDIARMDDERGLLGHPVHDIDGLGEGPIHVGIRLLVEPDMGVADLHEQRLAQPCDAWLVIRGPGQIHRREDAACQDEQCASPAIGHAFERVATRLQQFIVRHGRPLKWWFRREDFPAHGFIPGLSPIFYYRASEAPRSRSSRTSPSSSSQAVSETAQYSRSSDFQKTR